MDLPAIPDWLGTAIVGTAAGGIGYLAKGRIEHRKELRARKSASLERLKRLAALLQQSDSVFVDQNNMVRRLWGELSTRLGKGVQTGRGFDEDFFVAYDRFTPEERELHAIIRGMTMNSMRTVNEQLAEWLSEDLEFKVYAGPDGRLSDLKSMLQELDRHLGIWHAKYAGVLAGDQKRSLVYVGDEKGHGVAFPHGIEKVVQGAIDEFPA